MHATPRRGSGHTARHPLALAGLAAAFLGLAACLPSHGWQEVEATKAPVVELVELRHSVRFETDKDVVTAAEAARLRAFLAGTMPLAGRESVLIEGHADERASDLYNLELAARRAQSVRRQLAAAGIPDDVMHTVAYGEAVPVDATSSPEAWRLNRRAEIVVRRHVVTLPDCADWSKPSGIDPHNRPSSHIGCASARNLAVMVADPADLVHGRTLGPADGVREADALRRYRDDNVRPLQY